MTPEKFFGKRKPGYVSVFITGFLFLLLMFVPCLLYALKKDYGIKKLAEIYMVPAIAVIAVFVLFTVIGTVKGLFKKPFAEFDRKNGGMWIFLGAAAVLGVFSYVCVTPSFVNDDTWEIVRTTLRTGKIYEYSSFTGLPLEAGLPIFNKVYEMPMFLSVLCLTFGADLYLTAGVVLPILVYVLHLWLVYSLAGEILPKKLKFPFMLAYLCVMAAGTYVPGNGIPVTAGFAVLREGYSGYAVFYGLVVPMCLLLVIQRRWIAALIIAATSAGLVRIDRIFFAIRDLYKSYITMNAAGKLFFLFILCIVALIVAVKKTGIECKWYYFLIPSVTIAYTAVVLSELFKTRKDRIFYGIGVCAVIFACCNFRPFEGAEAGNYLSTHKNVKECSGLLPEGARVLSTKEFMEKLRRVDGRFGVAVSRANYTRELAGLDFEEPSKHTDDYLVFAKNYSMDISAYGYSVYAEELTLTDVATIAASEGINVIVIPVTRNSSEESYSFSDAGFEYLGDKGGFSVYGLKEVAKSE